MAANSLDPNAAAGRLREMLGGLSSAYPPEPQPPPARPVEPKPVVVEPTPPPAPAQAVEPRAPQPQVMYEAMAQPQMRPAPQFAPSGEKLMDSEKTHVLEGFHRWVAAKVNSVQENDGNAAALEQVIREIAGVAGFVNTLLAQGQDE